MLEKLTVSPYSDRQINAWLRGLLTVAWADGQYQDEEQELITQLIQELVVTNQELTTFEPITPEDLALELGLETNTTENFLRTAVLVALADGTYSASEAELLQQFNQSLELDTEVLKSLQHTLYQPNQTDTEEQSGLLHPIKTWLDELEVQDPRLARFLCKMIPSQCPFERDITLFGHKIVHIPPLCKLNPLYEQLVGLRFRSLTYLSEDCHEDVTPYI